MALAAGWVFRSCTGHLEHSDWRLRRTRLQECKWSGCSVVTRNQYGRLRLLRAGLAARLCVGVAAVSMVSLGAPSPQDSAAMAPGKLVDIAATSGVSFLHQGNDPPKNRTEILEPALSPKA